MSNNTYISEILNGLGLAINEKNNSEIIVNYPIKFDKKSMKFIIDYDYKVSMQMLGTFLSDFLNTNFEDEKEFTDFFIKYSLTLLDYKSLSKLFKDKTCDENNFESFINKLLIKNKKEYLKLQEQTDMILDYCLINPNKRALSFTPIERLYVLRRISANLTLLNENKAAYYSVNLFSSYPGNSEKEIYDFLGKKSNKVTKYDLILPYTISSIIYKSLCAIFENKVYLKSCKNCNKYFIADKKSISYCNNIAPSQRSKTCREIGRKLNFENNINQDPVLNLYYQVYNRKAMMKTRNPDIQKYVTDFNKYKEAGKKKINKYKAGLITSEEFKSWINKNI